MIIPTWTICQGHWLSCLYIPFKVKKELLPCLRSFTSGLRVAEVYLEFSCSSRFIVLTFPGGVEHGDADQVLPSRSLHHQEHRRFLGSSQDRGWSKQVSLVTILWTTLCEGLRIIFEAGWKASEIFSTRASSSESRPTTVDPRFSQSSKEQAAWSR